MISVIVPVYNAESYIERMIQSVIQQTSNGWELILVDDGSTDHSFSICEKYKNMDGRIKLIYQENSGVSAARNMGLRNASGQFIAFCDADDYYEPDFFSRFETFFQSVEADLFVFGVYIDYPGKALSTHVPPIPCRDAVHPVQDAVATWFDIYWMGLWNKIYKRSIITDYDILFQENIFHDEDSVFNLNYLKHCKSIFCSENPVYHYVQQNAASITRSFSATRLSSIEIVEKKLIELAETNDADVQAVEQLCRFRKMDMAYGQLCILMEMDMNWGEKKKAIQKLQTSVDVRELWKLKHIKWQHGILLLPCEGIGCFFGIKNIRKRMLK